MLHRSGTQFLPRLILIKSSGTSFSPGVFALLTAFAATAYNIPIRTRHENTHAPRGAASISGQRNAPADRSICFCEQPRHASYSVKSRCLFKQSTRTTDANGLNNNILLVSGILSPIECKILIDETDRILDDDYRRDLVDDFVDGDEGDDGNDKDRSLRRVSLCDMSEAAQSLSNEIIFSRVLPAVRHDNPKLLESIGLSNFDAPSTEMEWASDEPSVNRYLIGGKFDPHRDGYQLTIILLLSEPGSFEGGGTRFFASPRAANAYMDVEQDGENTKGNEESVVIKPPQGTAILFNGDITHAGCPVQKGVRHLFVASFSLRR